ncbi:MAG TPA: PadR family transcriptional regulator [Gemmatimonadaceae bacterium]|nr:PadR family transcriptional regulator [Gemmatimonadaceae bacterium]
MPDELDLLRGTLDLFILKALTWNPMHGLAVARWIERVSQSGLQIEGGALYPALHRKEQKGWLDAEWGMSDQNRRAKFYRLMRRGRAQLTGQVSTWERYVRAATLILSARRAEA